MSDKLFCGDCLGTDQQHAIWEPCLQPLATGIISAAYDYVAAVREQRANETCRAIEMAAHYGRLDACEQAFRNTPTPEPKP